MDLPLLRGLMSLAMLVTFLGLFLWVFRGSKTRFEDAAALPFAEDPPSPTNQETPKP
jgi:Cbb3-type cytochrome oxidase component FixQ.